MNRTVTKLVVWVAALMLVICLASGAQDIDKLKFPKLNPLDIPKVEKMTLDNGLRLYVLEDRTLPLFRASVRINCGSYLEPADQIGLGSVCGTVMRTGGTNKWTGDEIDEILEGIGGSVETDVDITLATANVNVLSDHTDLGLEVLSEILRRPVFDEDKIELAKVQMKTAISRRNDQISQVALREYRKLIYGAESSYARHPEYATINAVTRDDLVDFHRRYFQPQNVQIAVWGDFDKETIVNSIKQFFGDWHKGTGEVPSPPKVDYDWRSQVYYIEKTDVEQSYVRIGHIGGLNTDPDYADRLVMNSILGEGFGSRVTDNVRTKLGLAYSTGGRLISHFSYPGYFFTLASTKPDNTIQAAREMIKQIRTMQTDLPTQEEMQKGKDGYLNSFVFNFDSRGEVLNRMMAYDFYGMPEDFLQKEKERVEQVTPEDIMEAANRNLRPDQMIVLVVGNQEEFDEPLTALGLGEPQTIDITIPPAEEETELAVTPENIAKGRQLLDLAADAMGGAENFNSITCVERKSTITLSMGGQEFSMNAHTLEAPPDKIHRVINFMGRQMYDIRNGEVGWKTDQMSGSVTEKTADDIAEDEKQFGRKTLHIFRALDDPYYQPVFDGSGEAAGMAVDWVALVDEDENKICRLGIDSQSRRVVANSYWGSSPMGDGTLEEVYSEFSEINGVQIPMKTNITMDGRQISTIQVSEYIINGDLPPNAFTKPE